MDDFLVTAIITTYKRDWKYVYRAISSVREQTYPNIEIIVVDDNFNGSSYSQDIREHIEKENLKVRYIKQNGNKGACVARNLGLWNANGYFVAYLDDDDEWLPEKIEKQVEAFKEENDDSIGMVSCDGYKIDENYTPSRKRSYNIFGKSQVPRIITFKNLLKGDYVGTTSQPLIVTDVIRSVGGFNEKFPARQDYEMWLRIAQSKNILSIKELLFNHYIHKGEQISKNSFKAAKGYWYIYKEFYQEFQKYAEAKQICIQNILDNARRVRLKDLVKNINV